MTIEELFENLKEASHKSKDNNEAYNNLIDVFNSIEERNKNNENKN